MRALSFCNPRAFRHVPGSLALLAVVLLLGAAGAARAQRSAGPFIRLRCATFDPLRSVPQVPAQLRMGPAQPGEVGLYLLQFVGPVRPEWVAAVQAQGIVFQGYVPDYAFLTRMTLAQAEGLRWRYPFVRWTGAFHPAYKLDPEVLATDEPVTLRARAFAPDAAMALAGRLKQFGADILDASGEQLDMPGSPLMAQQLARTDEVVWVEIRHPDRFLNDTGSAVLGAGGTGGVRAQGLFGEGQIVCVADSGLDTGNASTVNDDFRGRILAGFGWARPNQWDDLHGHGTHVAGSVLGSGTNSGSDASAHAYGGSLAGVAPEAGLVFQSMGLNSLGSLRGPLDTADLFRQAYPLGARVHTNSWGGGFDNYSSVSATIDDYIYKQPDLVVLFAAGNSGADADGDGIIDQRGLGTQAVAKNVITVGASENNRPPNPQYGARDPRNSRWGGAPPFATDYISNNPDGMAAFSSRGPTADGRIKPDVVAPGTNVVSAWARDPASNRPNAWSPWAGPYSDANPISKYTFSSGTSMATPLTAGSCALVREFFTGGGYYGRRFSPTAALVKAVLINGAFDMNPGQYGTAATREMSARPNFVEGWGRVDLASSLMPQSPRQLFLLDGVAGLTTGQFHRLAYRVKNGGAPLRVTLVWSDPAALPSAQLALVNNLDLQVTDPQGNVVFGNNDPTGDTLNNVEGIDFGNPQTGEYEIRVTGINVPVGAQSYSLVVTGAGEPVGGRFPDVVPPVVSFNQPVPATTTVSGTVRVEVFAMDDRPNGIERVVLWLDGTRKLKTMYAPPFVYIWNTRGYKPGLHTLKAEASDFGRNRAETSMDVTVK